MRRRAVFLILLLCPLSSGCAGLFRIGTRNLLYEARLVKDSRIERLYLTHLAHQAWEDVRRTCPRQNYSSDYVCGFKAGFVDYLYAGGNGEPPSFVPKRYLTFHEQKSHGCQGLLDWYAGFRHGSAVANASGLRQSLVIALPPPPGPHPPPPTAFVPGPVPEDTKLPDKTLDLPMPKSQPSEASKQTEPAGKPGAGQPAAHGPDMAPLVEAEEKANRAPRKDEPEPEEQP